MLYCCTTWNIKGSPGPFFLCRRQSSDFAYGWISHYSQWEKNKISISIAKIQDSEEIFQYVFTGISCVDLRKEKVGVPDHLFFRRIAGPSVRRDSQNWTQMEYCDTFTPFLPYVMIQCCVHLLDRRNTIVWLNLTQNPQNETTQKLLKLLFAKQCFFVWSSTRASTSNPSHFYFHTGLNRAAKEITLKFGAKNNYNSLRKLCVCL